MKQPPLGRLIPDSKLTGRYGVTSMTLRRWDMNPDLGFPPAIVINNRKYRREAELLRWEAEQASKGSKGRMPGQKRGLETGAAA